MVVFVLELNDDWQAFEQGKACWRGDDWVQGKTDDRWSLLAVTSAAEMNALMVLIPCEQASVFMQPHDSRQGS